jgi:cephalosporin hydroxylase
VRQLWTDNDHCTLDGVQFEYGKGDYNNLHTTLEKVWVLKGKNFFDLYDRHLAGVQPRRVLEVGIFEGGSALLFADRWPEAKIAAFDIRKQNEAVIQHSKRMGFEDKLTFHYGVSQADPERVRHIIDTELDGSPDLVIDDASHQYSLTRQCFEIVFPRLARGGLYIVEDWAWAHWEAYQTADHPWAENPALSNLLFEVSMVAATSPQLISEVYLNRALFAVRKGAGVLPDTFRLKDHYLARGRSLELL